MYHHLLYIIGGITLLNRLGLDAYTNFMYATSLVKILLDHLLELFG